MTIKPSEENVKQDNSAISKEIQDVLIELLGNQLRMHNLYMSFSNYYYINGFVHLSIYYSSRASEKFRLHNIIQKFLQENNVDYKYPTIVAINEEYNELIDPIEYTVKAEEGITTLVYKLVELATKEQEYITLAWANSSFGLLQTQLREESLSGRVLALAKVEDSWISKELSILKLYHEHVNN